MSTGATAQQVASLVENRWPYALGYLLFHLAYFGTVTRSVEFAVHVLLLLRFTEHITNDQPIYEAYHELMEMDMPDEAQRLLGTLLGWLYPDRFLRDARVQSATAQNVAHRSAAPAAELPANWRP
jgi:hypothetical protein